MEFWGVEVPSGKPLTCKPGLDSYVHVSQAALGDSKNAKGSDRVVLKVKVGTNEVIVGTLSQGKCDQTTLDLIFEKDFVLSHNSSGSVYFCGYKTDAVRDNDSSEEEDDEFDMGTEDDDDDELEAHPAKENGKAGLKAANPKVTSALKPVAKTPALKPEASAGDTKPKAKPVVVKEKSGKDDDDEDEDSEEDEEEDSDDDMLGSMSEDDEDLSSDEEDESDSGPDAEEQPKSGGKKRPAQALLGASAGKKGKTEIAGGKPEPKTPTLPASTPKKQQQSSKKDASAKKTPGKEISNTPASGKKLGQFFCQPCSKNFNSESALTQHQTAKHK